MLEEASVVGQLCGLSNGGGYDEEEEDDDDDDEVADRLPRQQQVAANGKCVWHWQIGSRQISSRSLCRSVSIARLDYLCELAGLYRAARTDRSTDRWLAGYTARLLICVKTMISIIGCVDIGRLRYW